MEFPALFNCADRASDVRQRMFLALIVGEYALLLLASVLALDLSEAPSYYWAYALVFVGSISSLLYRTLKKPEQNWYRARALAESVKTSCWRYVMRAEPFNIDDDQTARGAFRAHLKDILDNNPNVADAIAGIDGAGPQITEDMNDVRRQSLEQRRDYYLKNRVNDQRAWYNRRAVKNKARAKAWTVVIIVIYCIALLFVLARISYPEWTKWPTEPLIVLAAAVIGWMQVNKFNELASAYSLTAHEIGLIQGKCEDVRGEAELSEFVNEAELAFSREHTQWVARQH